MRLRSRLPIFCSAVLLIFSGVSFVKAQGGSTDIEGRLRARSAGQTQGLRILLVKQSGTRQVTETFSRPDGQFTFRQVSAGDYAIEVLETPDFQAARTTVSIQPVPGMGGTTVPVFIDLMPKASSRTVSGVLPADIDVDVPKAAFKHYRDGLKAVEAKESAKGISEFRAAIEVFPNYYAARLELGRELRTQKQFQEAADALRPLREIAPRRAEPHVEYGLVLLGMEQKEEAATELRAAIQLEEKSWAPHYFLGLALFDIQGDEAAKEFARALQLNETKAARAHVALARLFLRKNEKEPALKHLETYLKLVPNASDAETVRKFADRLRSSK